ncbi:hypothetical protein B0H13DRAFT_1886067 [Mycena leptocephala]|nr:hypothetical protein B0H13DRAFT_1886067 [Mycena leptocephala]
MHAPDVPGAQAQALGAQAQAPGAHKAQNAQAQTHAPAQSVRAQARAQADGQANTQAKAKHTRHAPTSTHPTPACAPRARPADRTDDYRLGGLIPSPDKISKLVDMFGSKSRQWLLSGSKSRHSFVAETLDGIISNYDEEKQSALHWDPTEWRLEIEIRAYKVFEELMTEERNAAKSYCEPEYDAEKANIHILELPEDDCIELILWDFLAIFERFFGKISGLIQSPDKKKNWLRSELESRQDFGGAWIPKSRQNFQKAQNADQTSQPIIIGPV